MIERFLSVLLGYLKLEAERASASGTSIFMQNSLGHLNNNKCVRLRLRLYNLEALSFISNRLSERLIMR